MQTKMVSYFLAERAESVVFIAIGLMAVVISLVLITSESAYRGMAYPLVAIGVIQIVVGSTVFFRTPRQLSQLTRQLGESPSAFKTEESGRMTKVMASFRLYKAIEIMLLASGLVMAAAFPAQATLRAAAVGMMLQSAIMLLLDLYAERRGHGYLASIQAFGD